MNKQRKKGRPTGRSVKMLQKLNEVERLYKEENIPIIQGCALVEISRQTFYIWEKENNDKLKTNK